MNPKDSIGKKVMLKYYNKISQVCSMACNVLYIVNSSLVIKRLEDNKEIYIKFSDIKDIKTL